MAAFNLKGSGATKFIFKFFISLIARAVRNRTSQIQIKTDEMNNTDKEKVSAKHNKAPCWSIWLPRGSEELLQQT